MEHFNESIKTLQKWLKIKSVKSEAVAAAPFGEGVKNMLLTALKDAEALGFKTVNYDNYAGEVVWGEGEKTLGILCHVDVVPEGNGWTGDPFQMEVRDGWLIGRGVADDKGPMITILYALKFLKEQGYSLK